MGSALKVHKYSYIWRYYL